MKSIIQIFVAIIAVCSLAIYSCKKIDYKNPRPVFTAGDTSEVRETTVKLTSEMIDINGGACEKTGHVWSSLNDVPDVNINEGKTEGPAISANGFFTTTPSGLTQNKLYFVRAYVVRGTDVWYSKNITTFKTRKENVLEVQTGSNDLTGIDSTFLTGNITNYGPDPVVQYGHVWSTTNAVPTLADSKTQFGPVATITPIRSKLKPLTPATLYYARAYATNNKGATVYGNVIQFTTSTLQSAAVTTGIASGINFNQFSIAGSVTSIGNSTVSAYGFVWSATNLSPTVADYKNNLGTTNAPVNFNATINTLLPGITYYTRAYATNTAGTVYGSVVPVTTTGYTVPTVTTGSGSGITTTGYTIAGNLTATGNTAVTAHGFVWSATNAVPTITDSKNNLGAAAAPTPFNANITGLQAGTSYYTRAYATNTAGTVYGTVITVVTTGNTTPTVTTGNVQGGGNNPQTALTMNGNLIATGNTPVTAYGFVWSATNAAPTIADSKNNLGAASAPIAYNSYIFGLQPGTTYHSRAYATNTAGTAYGAVVDATTAAYTAANVVFDSISVIYSDNQVAYATIATGGNSTVTSYGIVWSVTNATPTILDNVQNAFVSPHPPYPFQFNMQLQTSGYGLLNYARAYITNSAGTFYSTVKTYVLNYPAE